MRFFNRNRKGQSTLEYAVLIAGIVGAVLIFKPYVQRTVQGRLKESSDRVGYKFGGTDASSIAHSYTTGWEDTGADTSTTTETYDVDTQNLTSETESGETVTRKEYESWGTTPPTFPTYQ